MAYLFHDDELPKLLWTAAPDGSLQLLHLVVPRVAS